MPWTKKKAPIKVLAPMAGYTDSAFRQICHQFGADLVVTELISADAVFYQSKNWYRDEKGEWQSKRGQDSTLNLLKFVPKERPILVQLFGKNPESFGFAAEWVTKNLKPDGIDINMGCPARKVVGSDHGAALLKNPELAASIIQSVKQSTNLPVSVKTRLGWENDNEILEFAPKLHRAGISAIIIHGRTYKDGFKGVARWDNIYETKKMLPELVVIGNGDIKTAAEGEEKTENLDGFAIGRATFGKPWIFSKDCLALAQLKELIIRHAGLAWEMKGEHGLVEFRKHFLCYLSGFAHAKELRLRAVGVISLEQVTKIVNRITEHGNE